MAAVGPIIGMALSSIATIGSNLDGDKTRGELSRLQGTDPDYVQSPYASQKFQLAQQLLNARMPGSLNAERQIDQNQAGMQASVQRNATDSGQALALAAAGQASADNAYNKQGELENQDYMGRVQNYNQGAQGMTDEGDKSYNAAVRRWQDQINITLARHGIRQQQGQNLSNLGSSISSFGGAMGGAGGAAAGK